MPNPPVGSPLLLRVMQLATRSSRSPHVPRGMGYRFAQLSSGAAVHVYLPEWGADPRAAVLWIHGGGFLIGNAAQDHRRCIALARDLGVVVFSAEYRHAPANPFPAALDDVHAVWTWILSHTAELCVDPARLAIAGQSAGGGLAATLVQRIHDEGGAQPVAQWLFCPMLDDRTAHNRELDGMRHFIWDNRSNRVAWGAYLGERDPDSLPYAVAARRRELKGLPPAWIGAGDIELFFDEDRRYTEALTAAGVDTTLTIAPGAPHAFESFAARTTVARAYLDEAEGWLRTRLRLG
ncbi:alpha/beta hydrolase [Leucobacter insecticola]|uniref:alpha/beta hydrolase n=1 Tax=Leucobacter insecticola TaxID=2714934 RepID=UPI00197F45D0|nr:alpha/beta hydrolase [Leucobacter insecticola]